MPTANLSGHDVKYLGVKICKDLTSFPDQWAPSFLLLLALLLCSLTYVPHWRGQEEHQEEQDTSLVRCIWTDEERRNLSNGSLF